MRQYFSIKAEHPGELLLFRMGDFWETFFDDAATLSRVLGITLTTRGVEKGEPVPLAGVPLVNLEVCVRKLIAAGIRVAICDQVEDAKLAKGLVRREVIEVVSAGTVSIPGLLEERVGRELAGIVIDEEAGRAGIARVEITTGEFAAFEIPVEALADEIDRLSPAEVLYSQASSWGTNPQGRRETTAFTPLPPDRFPALEEARQRIAEGPGFGEGVETLATFSPLAVRAAGALLVYLESLRKAERSELHPLVLETVLDHMVLDEISIRNLELLQSLDGSGTKGTLVQLMDRTATPMGARLLRRWIVRPLLSSEKIAARQDAVAELRENEELFGAVVGILTGCGDIERLSMRVSTGRAHARDLVGLATSLSRLPGLAAILKKARTPLLGAMGRQLADFTPEVDGVFEAFVEAPPLAVKDGGMIRDGYSEELDRLRDLSRNAKDWIARFQASERERTGISNLKVGYNRVFGYYLEVTRGAREAVPADYERRQTLAGAERYVTPELKTREAEILGADERSRALEFQLFQEVRERLALRAAAMRRTAQSLAILDCLGSFAACARRGDWVRPVVNSSLEMEIVAGRHPVVEAALPAHEFVPNDVSMDGESRQILLITGPNMAGKSTYLRQAALLSILAQMGSFVPAQSARLGVVDRIFTRVGASDHVARGHSTFMVEMTEVSRILSGATPRSLLLLDEVGRGTSTYDGLAIAWAVIEYLHETPERAARTLFATHYHELTVLADRMSRAVNLRVTVHEWKDDIVFLRKIVEGAADRSFGIQVARLAGLPDAVTKRAKKILAELEEGTFLAENRPSPEARGSQLDLFSLAGAGVLAELQSIHPERMTPLEALAVLHEWKKRTSHPGGSA